MIKRVFAVVLFVFAFNTNVACATNAGVEIDGKRTMLPILLPHESVGFEVGWDAGRSAVLINTRAATEAQQLSAPTPAPTPPPLPEIVYSLSEDANLRGIASSTNITNRVDNFKHLGRFGNPTLTAARHRGVTGISITGRVNNWDGLSISIPALNLVPGERYTIEITGSVASPIPEGAEMVLFLRGEGTWAWISVFDAVSADKSNFTLRITNFTTETVWNSNIFSDFQYFTVQSNDNGASMSFTVDGINVFLLPPLPPADRFPSLSEAFSDYFLVGNMWEGTPWSNYIFTPGTIEHFLHQYNAVTSLNYQAAILPEAPNFNPEEWRWTEMDFVADWANANNIYIVGHTLIWHEVSRPWLTDTDRLLTRAEAIANMELYINAVAGRYSGRFDAWDVVNEGIASWLNDISDWNANPDWRHHARRTDYNRWYQAFTNGARGNECGTDYIYYAYRFARIADPHALLIYNDYFEFSPGKREAIAHLVEQINERWQSDPLYDGRLLIEVIGMQGHYDQRRVTNPNAANLDDVRVSIERFIKTGVRIHVTEMDYSMRTFTESRNRPVIRLTPAELRQQADMYRDLFALFMEYSDYIDRVTFWGMADDWSWLSGGAPTLYTLENGNFDPKPAFEAILELVGIEQ